MGRANLRGLGYRPTMAVVANSHRTAQLLIESGATGERSITVIHPPTQPPEPPVAGLPRAFCTQVNLSQAKGGEILRRVAKALPEVPFLAVIGGHGEQIIPPARVTNVTPYGHFSGLGLPYGMTKVLLAPSSDETYHAADTVAPEVHVDLDPCGVRDVADRGRDVADLVADGRRRDARREEPRHQGRCCRRHAQAGEHRGQVGRPRRKVEPQDVLQEVTIEALRLLPEVDLSERDPFGWLCQIAEQRIIDAHRKLFGAQKRADRAALRQPSRRAGQLPPNRHYRIPPD